MTAPVTAPPVPDSIITQVRDETLALLATTGRPLPPDGDVGNRVTTLARRALVLIWHRVGLTAWWPVEEWPDLVIEAAATVTRELYLRKDAPFGITGAWDQGGEAFRVSRDPLAGVEYLLAPFMVSGSGQIA